MSSDVIRGINSAMDLVATGVVTKTLVVPAGLVNDAVKGAGFVLPPAKGYAFDLANAGTIDDAGHTAKLDMLVQALLPDGVTWQDLIYQQAANRTAARIFVGWSLDFVLNLTQATIAAYSSGAASISQTLKDTGASTNAVSVSPTLTSGGGQGGQSVFAFARQFRLVGVGRTASPTVGDTISLSVSAVIDPNEGV